jgi:hypothetical protein
LIRLAFGQFLSRSAGRGEAAGRACLPTAIHSIHAAVRESEEPDEYRLRSQPRVVNPAQNERVPCVLVRIVSLAGCPVLSRSAPDMSSRAGAAMLGIYRYLPAMWCCPAGAASSFRSTLASCRASFHRPPGGSGAKKGSGRRSRGRKKLLAGQEPSGNSGIDW